MNIISSSSIEKSALDILLYYINHGNIESAKALLSEKELNPNTKTNLGMTPLIYAVMRNNLIFTNLLLDYGADPNEKSDYSVGYDSPLTIACDNNNYDIAELLIDFGANPNEKNKTGLACIHLASQKGYFDIVILLVSRGADVNLRDDYGYNAGYYAKKYNYEDIINYVSPSKEITPEDLVEYKDQYDEKRFEITGDDKKKIRAQIAKDLKAEEAKNKNKAK